MQMQGRILAYSAVVRCGVIYGADGRQYTFGISQWRTPQQIPCNDCIVNFNPVGCLAENVTKSITTV